MRNTKIWLDSYLKDYSKDPKQTLIDLLTSMTEIVEDTNFERKLSLDRLASVVVHNKLFLEAIDKLEKRC